MNDTKYRIGILGAGQLALFLVRSLLKRDHEISFIVFGESSFDPVNIFYPHYFKLLADDRSDLISSLNRCQTVILESEFFSVELLQKAQTEFVPSIKSYKNFYGKIAQREFYHSLDIPGPRFVVAKTIDDLRRVTHFPAIIKKDHGSYDGKGNFEVANQEELIKKSNELSFPLLIEEKVSLKGEFSVALLLSEKSSFSLPKVMTYQENHVCRYVLAPFSLSKESEEQLELILEKLKRAKLYGFFAFEFFETTTGEILINEGAARPHNSMHLTLDTLDQSQFDLIISLALNELISKPKNIAKEGAMINLLGMQNCLDPKLILPEIPDDLPYNVYLYGKREGRVGRKMGHLNIVNNSRKSEDFIKILHMIDKGYHL